MIKTEKSSIEHAATMLRQRLWNLHSSTYYRDHIEEFKYLLVAEENKVCLSYTDRELFRTTFLFGSDEQASIFKFFMDCCFSTIQDELSIGAVSNSATDEVGSPI